MFPLGLSLILLTLGCGGEKPAAPKVSAPPPVDPATIAPPVKPAPTVPVGAALEAPALLRDEAGVRLEKRAWSAGEEAGWIWSARLPRDAALDVVPVHPGRALPALLNTEKGPFAAISGGYADAAGMPQGLVVSGGFVRSTLQARGGGGVLLSLGGPARIISRDDFSRQKGVTEALQSADRLVGNGRPVVTLNPEARRGVRGAVALAEDAVWLVVAAGKAAVAAENEQGVTLGGTFGAGLTQDELCAYLVTELHAIDALNVQGAASGGLVVDTAAGRWTLAGDGPNVNAVIFRPGGASASAAPAEAAPPAGSAPAGAPAAPASP